MSHVDIPSKTHSEEGLLNIWLWAEKAEEGREWEKDIIRAEFTGSRRANMHPYLGPDWAEQHRRASRCTEAEPPWIQSPSQLHIQLAGPRSQVIHYLPLMLWWICLQHTAFPLIWGKSYFSLSLNQKSLHPWLLSPVNWVPRPPQRCPTQAALACTLHLPVSLYIFLDWRIIALQCCGALCHTSMLISHNYIYIYIYLYPPTLLSLPPPAFHPSRSSQSSRLGSLCYIAASHKLWGYMGLPWWFKW